MRIGEDHRAKCGIEGKCSVPMFTAHGDEGFCDAPAWSQQYAERRPSLGDSGKHAPASWTARERNGYFVAGAVRPAYAPDLCCKQHGGAGPEDIRFVRDGNAWCAFLPDFVNLAESIAGFGGTQDEAEDALRAALVQ